MLLIFLLHPLPPPTSDGCRGRKPHSSSATTRAWSTLNPVPSSGTKWRRDPLCRDPHLNSKGSHGFFYTHAVDLIVPAGGTVELAGVFPGIFLHKRLGKSNDSKGFMVAAIFFVVTLILFLSNAAPCSTAEDYFPFNKILGFILGSFFLSFLSPHIIAIFTFGAESSFFSTKFLSA